MPDDLDDGGLFEVDPAQPVKPDFGMSKPPVDKARSRLEQNESALRAPLRQHRAHGIRTHPDLAESHIGPMPTGRTQLPITDNTDGG
ncbi:hypothetical protein [Rhodococcus sp. WAY2]|uniref:hypothetical protein n=1 Tax=Rhodococcus sp. WAY2 TaxID=2663121 RepID=UPI000A9F81FF|nr:hypothetical protein [Rhodococcus sp. WAY2]QHE73791.1 hypothetical protein GFS60_07457 [Rhodococcus sp. WAY2]